MSHVSVNINNRLYRMACDDGQEDHLIRLAEDLDRRISQLRGAFGEIGDMRLTVMAALTIGDELADTRRRARALEGQMHELESASGQASEKADVTRQAIARAMEAAAERIERLARTLNANPLEDMMYG